MGYKPRLPAPPPKPKRQPKSPEVWLKRKMVSLMVCAALILSGILLPLPGIVEVAMISLVVGVYLTGSIGMARAVRAMETEGERLERRLKRTGLIPQNARRVDLRRHHPVQPEAERLADLHEHQLVSVHLAGYPEHGDWKGSLLAYLCTDPTCSEQVSIERAEALQRQQVHGHPVDRGGRPFEMALDAALAADFRVLVMPNRQERERIVANELRGACPCGLCGAPIEVHDSVYSDLGHGTAHEVCGVEEKTKRYYEHLWQQRSKAEEEKAKADCAHRATFDPAPLCDDEEEWLWQ